MKTVFDKITRVELIARINRLNKISVAQWGKMDVCQMLKHCIMVDEMYLGRKEYKRTMLGRIIGQWALKNMLKDDRPIGKNAPTGSDFKVNEVGGDIDTEKAKWISLINAYESLPSQELEHWFFGKMTPEQVGQFAFKHTDHHLRQFNV